jgi:biofilm PGA synthesis N-glycosyltransferase PgaC
MGTLNCCIAVMAYNEEANIGNTLRALSEQQLDTVSIAEIVVVASGCEDRTEEIVREWGERDPRIRLISQQHRRGKSAAINTLLRNTQEEIIVLANADNIPLPSTIERLVAPFADPLVGMTGGHPMPTNDTNTFMGYMAHLLWTLHHEVSLRRPKMGELIAFRNFFYQIPAESAVDEASIEPLIRGQGLQIRYVAEAIVLNRGPETISDFLRQRRRIYAGHVYVRDTLGYKVSTMKSSRILWLLLTARGIKRNWQYVAYVPLIVALEVYGRLSGFMDYRVWKRKHTVWEVIKTTKAAIAPSLSGPDSH